MLSGKTERGQLTQHLEGHMKGFVLYPKLVRNY